MDQARNDLFSHIHRCGVLKAEEEQQQEWLKDTVEYLGECYPALTPADLEQLTNIGIRFCRPVMSTSSQAAFPAESNVSAA